MEGVKPGPDGDSGPGPLDGSSPRQTVVRLPHERVEAARMCTSQDRVADAITSFAETTRFVYLHALWFTVWIGLNEGLLGKAGIRDQPAGCGLTAAVVCGVRRSVSGFPGYLVSGSASGGRVRGGCHGSATAR